MDPTTILLPNSLQNAAVLTVVLAFAGYLVTFLITRMMARRADMLRLVNKRLNEFYGPLYVASQAGNIAYRSLLKKQGKTQSEPILDSEMKEWVLWMSTIFMPLNDIREKIIIEKAHLIVEEEMPHCLLQFVTHVVGYKAYSPSGQTATTPSAAPPSAGHPSSTATSSAAIKPSSPSRCTCSTTPPGASTTTSPAAGESNAENENSAPNKQKPRPRPGLLHSHIYSFIQVQSSVPHPCGFFLPHGWDSNQLNAVPFHCPLTTVH